MQKIISIYGKPLENSYFITDGQHIKHIQRDDDLRWSVSSEHKPNQKTGTGYRLIDGLLTEGEAVEWAKANMSKQFPVWATPSGRAASKPYKDLNDFLTSKYPKGNYTITDL